MSKQIFYILKKPIRSTRSNFEHWWPNIYLDNNNNNMKSKEPCTLGSSLKTSPKTKDLHHLPQNRSYSLHSSPPHEERRTSSLPLASVPSFCTNRQAYLHWMQELWKEQKRIVSSRSAFLIAKPRPVQHEIHTEISSRLRTN